MRYENQARQLLDMKPGDVFGRRKAVAKDGEVGIEIECEGQNLLQDPARFWKGIPDNSLRGESIEYVLSKPISRDKVNEALNSLEGELKLKGSKINESYRTSVHVHLNAQPMTMRQVFNQICLYLIFEDILVELCGKERIGNVFCLRASDAEGLVDTIRKALKSGAFGGIASDAMRYAAINTKALVDHGSLEFRSFRGTVDPNLIEEWVNILLDIKDAAVKYDNPQDICRDFSAMGPEAFTQHVFRPINQKVILAAESFDKRLFEGVRIAQDIAYALQDWSPVDPAEDFPKKVAVKNLDDLFQRQMNAIDGRFPDWRPLPRGVIAEGIIGGGMAPPAWQQQVIVDDVFDDDDQPFFEPEDDEDF